MKLAVLVTAGGYGRGSQKTQRKSCQILEGVPVVVHTLRKLASFEGINHIYLTVPPEDVSFFETEILKDVDLPGFRGVIPGGMLRQDSLKRALDHIGGPRALGPIGGPKNSSTYEYVLIHDGNRPLVSHDILSRTIAAAEIHGAAVAAVAERNTIKGITRKNFVALSYDRRRLRLVQTPQAYRHDVLTRAYALASRENFYGPDDSVLVERLEEKIKVVAGSRVNLQIRTRDDLLLAKAILRIQQDEGLR